MGIVEPLLDLGEPDAFGDRQGFWVKYEKHAGDHTEEVVRLSNSNLDVLLIFAGLFSAVNTAFIVLTINGLSSDPSAETNAILRALLMVSNSNSSTPTLNDFSPNFVPTNASIRQNCTFFASLCSSLLAATGAVLAKQWLQNYERQSKTSSVKKQALERTEKFIGAETWRLLPIVEALPTLLLISLALFFAGLSDYLWTINQTVAIVVIAFATAGVTFYGFTLIAAAIYKDCPFQSSPGFGLREGLINFLLATCYTYTRFSKAVAATVLFKRFLLWIYWPLTGMFGSFNPMARHLPNKGISKSKSWISDSQASKDREVLYTRAALWMVENVPERDIMLILAENIPLLTCLEAVRLVPRTKILPSLLHHLRLSLLAVQLHPTASAVATATKAAHAVAYVVLADPEQCRSTVWKSIMGANDLDRWEWRRWLPSDDLMVVFASIVGLCQGYSRDTRPRARSFPDVRAVRAGLEAGNLTYSTAITYLHHCTLVVSAGVRWGDQQSVSLEDLTDIGIKILSLEGVYRTPASLSFLSQALSSVLAGELGGGYLLDCSVDEAIRYAWSERTGKHLLDDVLTTLQMFNNYLVTIRHFRHRPISLLVVRYLTLLLSRLGEVVPSWDSLLREDRSSLLESSTSLQKLHFVHNAILRSLRQELGSIEARDSTNTIHALRGCQTEFLRSTCSLLCNSSPASLDLKVLDDTSHLILALGGDQDTILDGILNVYDYALQDFFLWGWRHTQRRPGHSFLASHTLLAYILARALQFHPSPAAGRAWRILQQLLGNMGDESLEPSRVLQHSASGPDAETSHILCKAQVTGPLIQILRSKSEEQGFRIDSVGRCLLWLRQYIHDQSCRPRQSDREAVVELFINVMRVMDWDGRGKGMGSSRGSIVSLGKLFLEAWASSWPETTSESVYYRMDLADETRFWITSAAIHAFAKFLHSIDHAERGNGSTNGTVPVEGLVDHELVRCFIQEAASQNPGATVVFGLDIASKRWFERNLERRESQSIGGWWDSVDAALFAARKHSIISGFNTAKWWQYSGLSETCHTDHVAVF
ncbi:hypothetical protein FRB98_000793 [Tulasnella sp. 332]|nr:hypothetical protein FRB98_000793 [Tulasnella sp. 332]